MLRIMTFKNFVHFEERQVIDFEHAKAKKKKAGKKNSKDTEATAKRTINDTKEIAKGKDNDAENIVKGTSNNTGKIAKETSKLNDAEEISKGTSNDKKEKAKGTFYATEEIAKRTSNDTAKGLANDTAEIAMGTSNDAENIAKRASNDSEEKARETSYHTAEMAKGTAHDTKETERKKTYSTEEIEKGSFNDTEEKARETSHDTKEIERETFNETEEIAKGLSNVTEEKARETSYDTKVKAKGTSNDTEEIIANVTSNDTEESVKKIRGDTETRNLNKLNFFVGANFCGKSSVIELIRRCMTKNINVSITNSFNENEEAYVFCKFDLHSKEVISGVIKEKKESTASRFHKILIYTREREEILRCNTFESCDSAPTENFLTFAETKDKAVLKDIFDKEKKTSTFVDHILKKIQSKENAITKREGKDHIDWKDLEDDYVATMPLRGIGIVQWTKSKEIGNKDRNYKMACDRAEIISELLDSKDIDKKKATDIFEYLTYPLKFRFYRDGEKICVKQGSFHSFPLLKTSEGIIEAKQVSLLLAHKHIKTLTLEEPCRGMHAQMIERLRTVLYQEGSEKTIIVSSHNPYFIDTITINNTYVFFRTKSNDANYSCKVRNLGLQKHLSKVSDIETLRNLLFATKVLLVEGPTDRDVVQALFTYRRECREMEIGNEEKPDITTYQIIPIGGCQNAKNVLNFCKYIHLPSLCLLDRDKFVSIQYLPHIPVKEDEIYMDWIVVDFLGMDKKQNEKFKEKYAYKYESVFFVENGFSELSDHLKKQKIFIWKYGALEDAVLSSEEMNDNIARSLDIKLSDPTTRCRKLKTKLKEKLDEDERRSFSEIISEVEEIKRFLEYLEDEENKRIQGLF